MKAGSFIRSLIVVLLWLPFALTLGHCHLLYQHDDDFKAQTDSRRLTEKHQPNNDQGQTSQSCPDDCCCFALEHIPGVEYCPLGPSTSYQISLAIEAAELTVLRLYPLIYRVCQEVDWPLTLAKVFTRHTFSTPLRGPPFFSSSRKTS